MYIHLHEPFPLPRIRKKKLVGFAPSDGLFQEVGDLEQKRKREDEEVSFFSFDASSFSLSLREHATSLRVAGKQRERNVDYSQTS